MTPARVPGDVGRADEPVRHPLNAPGAAEVLAERPELTAEEAWIDLVVTDGWMENEDGTTTSLSGISWRQLEELEAQDAPAAEPVAVLEVDAEVLSWLAEEAGGEREVSLSIDSGWSTSVSTTYQQVLALLRGEVATRGDWTAVRAEAIAARKVAGEAALAPLSAAVEAAGGRVLQTLSYSGALVVAVTPEMLGPILEVPGLSRVGLESAMVETAGYSMVVDGGPRRHRDRRPAPDVALLQPELPRGSRRADRDRRGLCGNFAKLTRFVL